jgi:hypothetical protein
MTSKIAYVCASALTFTEAKQSSHEIRRVQQIEVASDGSLQEYSRKTIQRDGVDAATASSRAVQADLVAPGVASRADGIYDANIQKLHEDARIEIQNFTKSISRQLFTAYASSSDIDGKQLSTLWSNAFPFTAMNSWKIFTADNTTLVKIKCLRHTVK